MLLSAFHLYHTAENNNEMGNMCTSENKERHLLWVPEM
jgi:hypothetical protein